MQAAWDWFDNIQTNQLEAYKLLYATMLELGNPTSKILKSQIGIWY